MTTQRTLLAATLLVAFVSVSAMGAGIIGSAHDFSGKSWAKNQICLPCHAPHAKDNSSTNYKAGYIWNHELTQQTTGIKMDMYSSSGLTTGDTNLDNGSILCMSCHDGTVALDSFGGVVKAAAGAPTNAGQYIDSYYQKGAGNDLTGNHPIGSDAVYPTDDYLKSTKTSFADPDQLGKNGYFNLPKMTVSTTVGGVTTSGIKMVVGCGTCHNPHNGNFGTRGDGMLRVPQTGTAKVGGTSALSGGVAAVNRPAGPTYTVPGSGLCLNCHIK